MKWLFIAIPVFGLMLIALTEARHEVRRLKGEVGIVMAVSR